MARVNNPALRDAPLPTLQGTLRRPDQPSHDIAELIEVAILDVNRAAAVAMIDRDGETKRIRHVFFHRDRVGFLFARLALLGLSVIACQLLLPTTFAISS